MKRQTGGQGAGDGAASAVSLDVKAICARIKPEMDFQS